MKKDLLKNTKSYLIGPMEFSDGRAWRENAEVWLQEIGVTVLNPYKNPFLFAPLENGDIQKELKDLLKSGDENEFLKVHLHMKQIVRFDLACVDRSDFLIAYINPKIPTFGSINEIVLARSLRKPLFLIIEGGVENCPLWLCGMFPPRYIYNSLEEVKKTILGIDSGEIIIDSDRWRLLKPELR